MSGQTAVGFEQPQTVDVADADNLSLAQEALEVSQADPIVSFLEKHGHKLISDHDGEMVTVGHAYHNCPPFQRLVDAIGEAALGMIAPKLAEEDTKDETEEIEDNNYVQTTKSGTKTEQKAGAKEPGKSANDSQKEKNAVKQQAPKSELIPHLVGSKPETVSVKTIPKNMEPGTSISSGGIVVSPPEASKPHLPQKMIVATSANEFRLTEIPSALKTPSNIKDTSNLTETRTEQPVVQKIYTPVEITVVANADSDESGLQLQEESQTDIIYMESDFKAGTSTDNAEIEEQAIQDNSELELMLPVNEQQQSFGEFVEQELSEDQDGEILVTHDRVEPAFNMPEHG